MRTMTETMKKTFVTYGARVPVRGFNWKPHDITRYTLWPSYVSADN